MGRITSIRRLRLDGAAEVQFHPMQDSRGWFSRWFCQKEIEEINAYRPVQQINSSFTAKMGVVRGLHFQYSPHMEDKMVRCIRGRVYDVIVDLRSCSPTRGQWCSLELSSEKQNLLYIPKGFAHGFQTLEPNCQILYLHTQFHTPESEGGYRYDSSSLGIEWPLIVTELSERDRNLPEWDSSHKGIDL